jgi:ABC-2 type transport system permease protein
MFWHIFKYEFLNTIKQKELVFWMMCFPIILGTFFNLAFGNLYEKEEIFNEIPVAVAEIKEDSVFREVMDSLSEGDSPLFKVQYTNMEEAEELLKNEDIMGIICVDDELSLSVAGNGLEQSIIKSFLEQYEAQKTIITDTAANNPEKLQDVIAALSADIDCIETKELSGGNMDEYVQYFQNLIAMVALFGTMVGLFAATSNEANLSAIGARKCVAPTHKLKSIIANLLAAFCAQVICVFISITYIVFILKIDMGDKIPMIYLSGVAGSFMGVSMGFLIGSIGRMSEGVKVGISTSFSMFCCFLSGLMVGNMKAVINQYCPIINKINPAAVISDLFYCLAVYDDYSRYMEKMVTLLIMSAIFITGGFLLTRRKKYASI